MPIELMDMLLLTLMLAVTSPAAAQPPGPVLFPRPRQEAAGGPQHWMELGRQELAAAEAAYIGSGLPSRAKNVVLFIGDGMGVSTLTAARILKGQLASRSGEEDYLAFERFQHLGLAKTYNTDHQTADSAGTATAYLSGVKTRSGLLGVSEAATRGNCSSLDEAVKLRSFLRLAADAGRAVGIVTTTRLTHATPAAAYCHTVDRNWEDDGQRDAGVPEQRLRSSCPDIARQFVDNAADFRVVLAGGRSKFLPKQLWMMDATTGKNYKGSRKDGANLIGEWKAAQSRAGRKFAYVETAQQLDAVTADGADSVLGLMAPSHLDYHWDNLREANGTHRQPSLAEMTTKAVRLLSVYGRSTGSVLLVEGGRIDHGHHANQANRALHETVALSEAVEATIEQHRKLGSLSDTLLMVTADHSHVFTLGHYGMRGQPITRFKYRHSGSGQPEPLLMSEKAEDDLPFTVVNYADGPGARQSRQMRWADLETNEQLDALDTSASDYVFPAMMRRGGESHGGEDVPIYAQGPGAHLVHRVHEQSYVAHVIMRAARLGPYAEAPAPIASSGATGLRWAAPSSSWVAAVAAAGLASSMLLHSAG